MFNMPTPAPTLPFEVVEAIFLRLHPHDVYRLELGVSPRASDAARHRVFTSDPPFVEENLRRHLADRLGAIRRRSAIHSNLADGAVTFVLADVRLLKLGPAYIAAAIILSDGSLAPDQVMGPTCPYMSAPVDVHVQVPTPWVPENPTPVRDALRIVWARAPAVFKLLNRQWFLPGDDDEMLGRWWNEIPRSAQGEGEMLGSGVRDALARECCDALAPRCLARVLAWGVTPPTVVEVVRLGDPRLLTATLEALAPSLRSAASWAVEAGKIMGKVVVEREWEMVEVFLQVGEPDDERLERILLEALRKAGEDVLGRLFELCGARGVDFGPAWRETDGIAMSARSAGVLRVALREIRRLKFEEEVEAELLDEHGTQALVDFLPWGDVECVRLLFNEFPDAFREPARHQSLVEVFRWQITNVLAPSPSSWMAPGDRLAVLDLLLNAVDDPAAVPSLALEMSGAVYEHFFIEGIERLLDLGLMRPRVLIDRILKVRGVDVARVSVSWLARFRSLLRSLLDSDDKGLLFETPGAVSDVMSSALSLTCLEDGGKGEAAFMGEIAGMLEACGANPEVTGAYVMDERRIRGMGATEPLSLEANSLRRWGGLLQRAARKNDEGVVTAILDTGRATAEYTLIACLQTPEIFQVVLERTMSTLSLEGLNTVCDKIVAMAPYSENYARCLDLILCTGPYTDELSDRLLRRCDRESTPGKTMASSPATSAGGLPVWGLTMNKDPMYYVQTEDDVFHPTNLTIGPWAESAQHGGPVSALIGHVVLSHANTPDPSQSFLIKKLSVHLYRPVPTRLPLRLAVRPLQTSSSVRHLECSVSDPSDASKLYARADAVLLRSFPATRSLGPVVAAGEEHDRPKNLAPTVPPAEDKLFKPTDKGKVQTYFHTMDFFFDHGIWAKARLGEFNKEWLAPALVRARPDVRLALFVDARSGKRVEIDGTLRTLLVGDSGSGFSAILPWGQYAFSNIDFTVNFLREPRVTSKDWVTMSSTSRVTDIGSGLCISDFYDASGKYAVATQNLVVKETKPSAKNSKL
ncbi:hypothetical protein HK101_008006 [Irineochytrium annulatum]|nr:hypothetical protein HK101_008006 [Irineochytrium annulatum]